MTVALIVAAGSGERLGASRPKALVELAGRPLLQWSVDALRRVSEIERIVIALPIGIALPAALEELGAGERVPARVSGASVTRVDGGDVRSESVRRALAAAGEGDPVLVHDAARPLLRAQLASAVIAALLAAPGADAAIAAVRVTDTVKRAGADRTVLETLERGELWSVQTPQVFRRGALERALEVPREELARATDDAWLIERRGGKVLVVPSTEENLKVTTAHDLRVAELLLRERAASPDATAASRNRA